MIVVIDRCQKPKESHFWRSLFNNQGVTAEYRTKAQRLFLMSVHTGIFIFSLYCWSI